MKKILIGLSILLIIVGIYGIGVGAIRENKNEKELIVLAQQRREKSSADDVKILKLNFYENLSESKDINALIIGDSISQSAGSSNNDKRWSNLVINDVKDKYKSTMTTDLITGGSTTGIRAWVELNSAKLTKKYDVAFMCFGQKDQYSMTPKQFGVFYESIIIKLKKINPSIEIIPIIESSFRERNSYSDIITELSKQYNLQQADTMLSFNSSVDKYESLSKDLELPNDKGYKLYAETILKVINSNVESKKKTNIKYNVLYDNTNKLNNFVFDNSPDLNNGFILEGILSSSKALDSLTFNTTKEVAIIHYLSQVNGGKFKVYIDGKFAREIDTKSTSEGSNSSLISDNLDGEHKIMIRTSAINKRETVKIVGLATN
ncbi:SGNH/GDSL hydrolase family protein [Clostridium lacusfryxellense]|uniref:SGNH/GDSL hydrolase family protein n=1 Tax=Clostridium lacusfryxellense TaxID=205328 RepID=UPI001C0E7F2F|nr:SGNH/GDSL hydrolase family protein [Clostridium lacusfryxellense]MBU3111006.1 SGNH/GDSL hydrolase family protein [Clostridium lacusfryxellense]